jgi:organic hydroperoxide reductase OsmC/OhrA
MSVVMMEDLACPRCSSLVWDQERHGTATTGTLSLQADELSDWTPDLLLATAVGTSLMTGFARLAADAGLPLLGYVAQQTATASPADGSFHLHVTPCITVASETDAARAQALWARAVEVSPVVRALRCPLRCEPHIVVAPDATPPDPER